MTDNDSNYRRDFFFLPFRVLLAGFALGLGVCIRNLDFRGTIGLFFPLASRANRTSENATVA